MLSTNETIERLCALQIALIYGKGEITERESESLIAATCKAIVLSEGEAETEEKEATNALTL